MPDVFFGMTMTTPWFYSLLYNGFYMGIDMVVCLVIFALLLKPMKKYFLARICADSRPLGAERSPHGKI